MKHDLKSELESILPREYFSYIPRSFDIIGSKGRSVAIIEIPEQLKVYEHEIAKAIIRVHKNVVSVLSKDTERFGEYRIRDMRLLYGDPNTEVLHKESGCIFKIDPKKAYFSPRESTERERFRSTPLGDEEVLVMFSGIGPLAICMAKNNPNIKVTAIELNPDAYYYCQENIRLNKLNGKIEAILGDVREVCPKLNKKFDRILMPLPKGAYKFLDVALDVLKFSGILHFYHWAPKENLWEEAENILTEIADEFHRKVEILNRIKISAYSPSLWKIRIDARIN
ncbi:class I SAM-dependent methyltransferase family protein [Candidatus Bathyarchaeota archaeon]|nr:class I SAM-dependent methyltransferase family protein [Candidatus Bathyarchaeota archaeon]